MEPIKVHLPDDTGEEYEYSTMAVTYSREGSNKYMRSTLTFGDAHGSYPFEVTLKDQDGVSHTFFDVESATVSVRGAYEAGDLISLFRKIIKHHDMQHTLLHGKSEEA